jgi:hypothetical protein
MSTAVTAMSSVPPTLSEGDPAEAVRRRSEGTAWPPELPPPPVDGGGGDAAVTVKATELVAVPAGVVTAIGPLVAPAGTVAESSVLEVTVKPATWPANVTAVALPRFVPTTVMRLPTGPLVGVIDAMVGAGGGGGGAGGTRW